MRLTFVHLSLACSDSDPLACYLISWALLFNYAWMTVNVRDVGDDMGTTWDSLRRCLFCDLYCSSSHIPVRYLYVIYRCDKRNRYRIFYHKMLPSRICTYNCGVVMPDHVYDTCYNDCSLDYYFECCYLVWFHEKEWFSRAIYSTLRYNNTIQQHIMGIKIVPNLYMFTSNQTLIELYPTFF